MWIFLHVFPFIFTSDSQLNIVLFSNQKILPEFNPNPNGLLDGLYRMACFPNYHNQRWEEEGEGGNFVTPILLYSVNSSMQLCCFHIEMTLFKKLPKVKIYRRCFVLLSDF
jgi:hypothetical protein